MRCEHKRIKKNFPFGKKSIATKHCKDCGEVITNKQLSDMKSNQRKRTFRNNKKR